MIKREILIPVILISIVVLAGIIALIVMLTNKKPHPPHPGPSPGPSPGPHLGSHLGSSHVSDDIDPILCKATVDSDGGCVTPNGTECCGCNAAGPSNCICACEQGYKGSAPKCNDCAKWGCFNCHPCNVRKIKVSGINDAYNGTWRIFGIYLNQPVYSHRDQDTRTDYYLLYVVWGQDRNWIFTSSLPTASDPDGDDAKKKAVAALKLWKWMWDCIGLLKSCAVSDCATDCNGLYVYDPTMAHAWQIPAGSDSNKTITMEEIPN